MLRKKKKSIGDFNLRFSCPWPNRDVVRDEAGFDYPNSFLPTKTHVSPTNLNTDTCTTHSPESQKLWFTYKNALFSLSEKEGFYYGAKFHFSQQDSSFCEQDLE